MATNLGDLDNSGALLQAQAAYAPNRRNLPLAQQRFEACVANCEQR